MSIPEINTWEECDRILGEIEELIGELNELQRAKYYCLYMADIGA